MNIGNPISSILNRATRKAGHRLNIITWMCHERYQPALCKINADFYSLQGPNVRPSWNTKYSEIPPNYYFVDEIPSHIVPDLCLSQNPFAHIPLGLQLSRQLHIPLINVFHTDSPNNGWNNEVKLQNQGFFNQCQHHIFISEYNKISWGFSNDKNTTVIEHSIDSELFNPGKKEKNNVILSVCNDYINRDQELGFGLWKFMTQGLPVKVVGDTKGLSEPANNLEELISGYQTSKIFLNTSLRSPIPCSLLEAAACGCAIVSTNTNAIPDIFTQGYDALIYSPNAPEQGRIYLERLLKDDELAKRLGENARKTVIERFKSERFVNQWETILNNECSKVYK